MAMSLRKQLESAGVDAEPWQFRDFLIEQASRMFPGWKDERITNNPKTAAIPYCEAVRDHYCVSEADMPDEMILAALHGVRKHSIKL